MLAQFRALRSLYPNLFQGEYHVRFRRDSGSRLYGPGGSGLDRAVILFDLMSTEVASWLAANGYLFDDSIAPASSPIQANIQVVKAYYAGRPNAWLEALDLDGKIRTNEIVFDLEATAGNGCYGSGEAKAILASLLWGKPMADSAKILKAHNESLPWPGKKVSDAVDLKDWLE